MREWQSLSHVRWYCKYHVVFVPKYRKRTIFGDLRRSQGPAVHVSIAQNEPMQQRLRELVATTQGRSQLRERVHVEHRLAHLSQKQGPRARYMGQRKNLFDLRRYAAVLNLEVIQRRGGVVAMAA